MTIWVSVTIWVILTIRVIEGFHIERINFGIRKRLIFPEKHPLPTFSVGKKGMTIWEKDSFFPKSIWGVTIMSGDSIGLMKLRDSQEKLNYNGGSI